MVMAGQNESRQRSLAALLWERRLPQLHGKKSIEHKLALGTDPGFEVPGTEVERSKDGRGHEIRETL